MKWLVTTPASIDVEELLARLSALGCSADENPTPIPLDQGEQVIEVEGPHDLPERAAEEPCILKVSPNSEFTLY